MALLAVCVLKTVMINLKEVSGCWKFVSSHTTVHLLLDLMKGPLGWLNKTLVK